MIKVVCTSSYFGNGKANRIRCLPPVIPRDARQQIEKLLAAPCGEGWAWRVSAPSEEEAAALGAHRIESGEWLVELPSGGLAQVHIEAE
jgi:hypothetical protein